MSKNKTTTGVVATSNIASQPPSAKKNQTSALSQQLEQASASKPRHSASFKRPSLSRKSKSDQVVRTESDISQSQTRPKRSPKSNKVNSVKQFSTPSKPPTASGEQHIFDITAPHYAGPTFHSSPAPSSLPIPSFLSSKSDHLKPTLQNGFDVDSASNQSTPIKNEQYSRPDQDDSPLASFFKAVREEKARLRNRYSNDSSVFEREMVRPSSAGETSDHGLRSESPLLWNRSSHIVDGQFGFKSTGFYNSANE
jgi:Proline-rich nuclear receptor coactivator motif